MGSILGIITLRCPHERVIFFFFFFEGRDSLGALCSGLSNYVGYTRSCETGLPQDRESSILLDSGGGDLDFS